MRGRLRDPPNEPKRDAMTLPRRQFLHLAAGAAALSGRVPHRKGANLPVAAGALIVGFPAGGVGDILARLLGNGCRSGSASRSSSRTGRVPPPTSPPRPSRVPADGYTLLWITSANAINATLYDKLSFIFFATSRQWQALSAGRA